MSKVCSGDWGEFHNNVAATEKYFARKEFVSAIKRCTVNFVDEGVIVGLQNFPEWIDQDVIGGDSPLMYAARNYLCLLVKVLLQFNVSIDLWYVNRFERFNASALTLAASYGHDWIVKVLLDHNASIDVEEPNPFVTSILNFTKRESDAVSLLLRHCPNLELSLKNGKTILLQVVSETIYDPYIGHWQFMIIRKLLQAGANVDAKDEHGRTALMLACLHKTCTAIIQDLITFGSDPFLSCNKYNQTALDYLVHNFSENYHEMGQMEFLCSAMNQPIRQKRMPIRPIVSLDRSLRLI